MDYNEDSLHTDHTVLACVFLVLHVLHKYLLKIIVNVFYMNFAGNIYLVLWSRQHHRGSLWIHIYTCLVHVSKTWPDLGDRNTRAWSWSPPRGISRLQSIVTTSCSMFSIIILELDCDRQQWRLVIRKINWWFAVVDSVLMKHLKVLTNCDRLNN